MLLQSGALVPFQKSILRALLKFSLPTSFFLKEKGSKKNFECSHHRHHSIEQHFAI